MRQIGDAWVYDSLEELVDPAHAALIVIDVQNDFCHRDGHFAHYGRDLSMIEATLPKIRETVAEAQALGVRVVFIRQTTLPDGKSDSPAWLRFKCRDGKSPEYTLAGSWGWEFVDGLTPGENDLVVEKFRPDAFVHTHLDQILRANRIEALVFVGCMTEGCVESTVRGASFHDYYTVVLRDAVASTHPLNHEGSMRLYEARYPLHDAEEVLEFWRRQTAAGGAKEAAGD